MSTNGAVARWARNVEAAFDGAEIAPLQWQFRSAATTMLELASPNWADTGPGNNARPAAGSICESTLSHHAVIYEFASWSFAR